MGIADHAKQGLVLGDAVNGPAGVEDLVPAMLRVGLGKHHQLDIAGIASEAGKGLHQVVDLILGQRQAQAGIRGHQGLAAATEDIHRSHRRGLLHPEQGAGGLQGGQHGFGHAIVEGGGHLPACSFGQVRGQVQIPGCTPLQALYFPQAAVAGDVGGLAGPGGDGARARYHQQQLGGRRAHIELAGPGGGAVVQQLPQQCLALLAGNLIGLGKVHELTVQKAESIAESFCASLSRRNGDRAGAPRKISMLGRAPGEVF